MRRKDSEGKQSDNNRTRHSRKRAALLFISVLLIVSMLVWPIMSFSSDNVDAEAAYEMTDAESDDAETDTKTLITGTEDSLAAQPADPADDPVTEEESVAQPSNEGGLTVSVKDTGMKKKLSGYHVVVENAMDDYKGEADLLQAYHIYLADKDNKEVSAEDLKVKTESLNLQVTLTYDELPEWFAKAKSIKHYKSSNDRTEQFISGEKFDSESRSISFNVHGFSDFVIMQNDSGSGSRDDGSADTAEQGSILENVDYDLNAANEWQIVSGEFKGNSSSNKTESSDGFVRVQKNVIPTENENEFLMYLGVDLNTTEILTKVITDAGIVYTPSNNVKNYGDFYENGDEDKANAAWAKNADDGNMRVMEKETADGLKNKWTVTFHVEITPGVYKDITTIRYASTNTFNQGHFALGIGDVDDDGKCDWIEVGKAAKAKGKATITIKNSVVEKLVKALKNVAVGTVIDNMGEGITAKAIVAATNGVSSASISADGKTITWNPVASTVGYTSTGWHENVAELVYRFIYDPTVSTGLVDSAGKTSVADYEKAKVDTNGKTAMTYKVSESSSGGSSEGSVEFTSPVIRGMLYELKLKKVDDLGNPVKGAEFTATQTKNTVNDHAQAGAAGRKVTVTSDENGYVDFTDLLWGAYTIEETAAPEGYEKSAAEIDDQILCYTTKPGELSAQGAGEEALKDRTEKTIVNPRAKASVKFKKVGVSNDSSGQGTPLEGAVFTIYKADENGDKRDEVAKYESAEKEVSAENLTSDSVGVFLTGYLVDGNYYIEETTTPAGYNKPESGVSIKVKSGEVTLLGPNSFSNKAAPTVATETDSSGNTVYVITIKNVSGDVLPYAGGTGTRLLISGGAAVTAIALLLYMMHRRRVY